MPRQDPAQLARKIKLLLMDVDGVLTDGRIILSPLADGRVEEIKIFNVQDGAALGLARNAGLKIGILSGRRSAALTKRAEEMKVDFFYDGLGAGKAGGFEEILVQAKFPEESVCFVGDDFPDLPILRRVGFPVAVPNAVPEVLACVAYVTRAAGGAGAVREVVEFILRAQGKWESAIRDFVD
jgi:3-deoxy-D-manno-octulosonate 8-phosphate phosphatase (KDO 8-P phosphatase)